MTHLYQELANRLARNIDRGIYLPGDRLPGVRVASANEGVSAATIVAAYQRLEIDGYLESRPRSGFYVRPRRSAEIDEPEVSKPHARPKAISGQQVVLQLIKNISTPGVVQLGANLPDPSFMPSHAISRELRATAREAGDRLTRYEAPAGLPALQEHIARRLAGLGCEVSPDDIVITNGCQEAIYLSLKSVTRPGDVVAVESPTYYGLLQILDSLGLKVLEIPTHPRDGISVEALQLACEQWPVKACVLVANFSNPLGALMPDEHKQGLMALLARYPDITLIEDDIYGDLVHGGLRPSTIKSFDKAGQVIYCSSFSKSLSAALRIGWAVSRRHREQLVYEKFVSNCATSTINQSAVAGMLEKGSYERHLRGMRLALAQNMGRLTEKILMHFPGDCKVTRPLGGVSLWIELPKKLQTTVIFNKALEQGISIAPGQIFSTDPKKYQHCMRLNAGVGWTQQLERAIENLGLIVEAEVQAI